jgi:TolA-binding protein
VLTAEFTQALDIYYKKQFKQALIKFKHILNQVPQDQTASFYSERCQYYLERGIPDDWDGIETLDKK